MGNILDLKNPDASSDEPAATPDVIAPESQETDTQSEPMLVGLFSGPETVSWNIEHQRTERGRSREYMLLVGALLLGALVSWWQASWLTFIVVLLGAAAWELHNRLPVSHSVKIDGKGVSVDGYRHEYGKLHSYDLHAMPDGTTHVSIKTKRWHLPHLHLALGEQSPEDVDALLSRYLLQDEHKIPLLEWFLKRP